MRHRWSRRAGGKGAAAAGWLTFAVALLLLSCGGETRSLDRSARTSAWTTTEQGFEASDSVLPLRVSHQGALAFRGSSTQSESLELATTTIARGSWRESLDLAPHASRQSLELARRRSRETVTLNPAGAEQSWVFDALPPGEGPLVVTVSVRNGKLVRSDDRGFVFRGGKLTLRYGLATWVDAAGHRTPVSSRFEDGQITLTVPSELLAATQFPATLDPIISPEQDIDSVDASGMRDTGPPAGAFCGGQYLVAWYDYSGRIFATRLATDGKVLDPGAVQIAPPTGEDTYRLQVACTGNVFGVVWYRYANSNLSQPTSVSFVRVSSSGAALDSPPINLPLSYEYALTADASNFVYVSVGAGAVRATRIAPSGQVLDEAPIKVANNSGAGGIWAIQANGGTQILWESSGGDYLARFEADGTVPTPVAGKLVHAGANDYAVGLAFDGQSFLAAYNNRAGLGSNADVYAYRFDAAGTILTQPFRVAVDQYATTVAVAQGNFLVFYGGAFQFTPSFLAPVTPDGTSVGAAVDLASIYITNVVRGSNGLAVLYGGRGMAQMLSASGALSGAPFTVANARREQSMPSVAALPNQYLVGWEDEPLAPVAANRLSQSGQVLDSTPIAFPPQQAFSHYPRVASDGAGEYLVLYYESVGYGTDTSELRMQRVSSQGTLVSPVKVLVTNADALSHDVAFDGQGYVLVWKTRDGVVRRSRYLTATDTLEPPVELTNLGYAASVGANSKGELAVWTENGQIRGRLAYRDATPAKTFSLGSGTDSENPRVASDGSNYLVVWRTTTTPSVRAQRWAANGTAIDAAPLSIDTSFKSYQPPAATFDGARYLVSWAGVNAPAYTIKVSEISGAGLQPALSLRTDVTPEQSNGSPVPYVSISSAGGQRSLVAYSVLLVDPPYGTTRVRARFLDYNSAKACSKAADCATGFCADGVCCDSACGDSNATDCQACSVVAGAAKNGVCGPALPSTVCRASAGVCDPEETCDGSSLACPADVHASKTAVCRPSQGACDAPELCDGGVACPTNLYQSSNTLCRIAQGACDKPDYCPGNASACPANALLAKGDVCRAALSVCDVAEVCNGTTSACPADAVAAPGTPCRDVAGACDVAEKCDGASPSCPADVLLGAGTTCRAAAGVCDVAESCSGQSATCPSDELWPSDHVCRPAAGGCDLAESCTSLGVECPSDALAPAGSVCRAATGPCDVEEKCGGDATCPSDQTAIDGTQCTAATACSGASTCNAGTCMAAAVADCDDEDPCTADSCVAPDGCKHAPLPDCEAAGAGGNDGAGAAAGAAGGEPGQNSAAGAESTPMETPNGGSASEQPTSGSPAVPVAAASQGTSSGCSCRVVAVPDRPWGLPLLGLLVGFALQRRRARPAARREHERVTAPQL